MMQLPASKAAEGRTHGKQPSRMRSAICGSTLANERRRRLKGLLLLPCHYTCKQNPGTTRRSSPDARLEMSRTYGVKSWILHQGLYSPESWSRSAAQLSKWQRPAATSDFMTLPPSIWGIVAADSLRLRRSLKPRTMMGAAPEYMLAYILAHGATHSARLPML